MNASPFPIFIILFAVIASKKRRRLEREEEFLTLNYPNTANFSQAEYKILRSSFPVFKRKKRLDEICADEARAGWELL